MKMYILFSEFGEYEEYEVDCLGVYTSLERAKKEKRILSAASHYYGDRKFFIEVWDADGDFVEEIRI